MNLLHNFRGIIDSTLREGQQFRSANFSLDQQKQIIRSLAQIGIERIEVGNPVNTQVRQQIIQLLHMTDRPKLLSHVRNRLMDCKVAKECGIEGVNIFCTVDENRLSDMGFTMDSYLEMLRNCIRYSKENHLEVRISVENFFQSNFGRIIQIYQLGAAMNVNRISMADTLGVVMAWQVEKAVKRLKKLFKTEIEVHFHNDLGQANSNVLAALKAGAHWVDTTLLGIGERSGITALSTFLASCYVLNPLIKDRYNLGCVTVAENKIAHMIGTSVPFNLFTNRENGFSHKAGVHIDAIITHGPQIYEPFAPEIFGNTRHLIYGTLISGKATKDDIKRFHKRLKAM